MSNIGNGNVESTPQDLSLILRDIAGLRDDLASVTRALTKDVGDQFVARGGRAVKAVENQVVEKPLVSLSIAVAAGILGARLLMR